jgi:hypothetical protein
MRPPLNTVLLTLAVIAASPVLAQEIRWHDNYPAAMEEATRTNKPLLVSFRCVP